MRLSYQAYFFLVFFFVAFFLAFFFATFFFAFFLAILFSLKTNSFSVHPNDETFNINCHEFYRQAIKKYFIIFFLAAHWSGPCSSLWDMKRLFQNARSMPQVICGDMLISAQRRFLTKPALHKIVYKGVAAGLRDGFAQSMKL
jgi:hypothetical protein